MKQKFLNKLLSFGKAVILLMFLLVEFFGFGFLPQAQAACGYRIDRMDFYPTNVTKTSKASVNAVVSYTADSAISDCLSQVSLVFWVSDSRVQYGIRGQRLFSVPVTFNNKVATLKDYQFNFGSISDSTWNLFPDPHNLSVFMTVQSSTLATNALAQSTPINLYVGGSSTSQPSTGKMGLKINFDPSLGEYQPTTNGGKIKVTIGLLNNYTDYPNEVDIVTTLNNKVIGNYSVPRASLANVWQDLSLTDSSIKSPGIPNDVVVSIYEKGTQQQKLVAQGTAQFKMASEGTNTSVTNKTNEGSNTNINNTTKEGPNTSVNGQTGTNVFDCVNADPKGPDYSKYCIYNPLPEKALTPMLLTLMKGFLGIVAVWAVAFIVIGGFRMVMAQGNEEAYTTAKKTITWAILGLVIALLSFSIVAMVQNFLEVDVKPVETTPTVNVPK